jgi:HK97 family phage portal protein
MVDLAGVAVSENGALGISAFYRAVSLISGTLASLPLRSLREKDNGATEKVSSIFDNPDGDDGQTPYEWKETLFLHLLLHGNAFALKLKTEAGGLARLPLAHPSCVSIEEPTREEHQKGDLPIGGKWFVLTLDNGEQVRWDASRVWHVPGLSSDGVRGISLIANARLSLATTIAGDKSAYNRFENGALISGFVTPEGNDDLDDDELKEAKRVINGAFTGVENAGSIPVLSRALKMNPWTMTAADAQFLQSRQFQIEEVARWTGVPPHLLMQTEKQTSWGTGVDEQNRGLAKFVLGPWANRVEQRGSRLLQNPRWIEFDFAGLERPDVKTEIELLIAQVQAGLLTINEARAIRNLPPLPEMASQIGSPGDSGEDEDDAPAE